MRTALLPVFLAFTALVAASTAQTIRPVPSGTYPTIQSAITASKTGDTILVSPGTYKETLTVDGIDITLRSLAGPKLTVIDGGGAGATVTFKGAVTRKCLLQGFTVTGGRGAKGGGIHIKDGPAPSIRECWINGNSCTQYGGGIGGSWGGFLLERCRIENNVAGGPTGLAYASGGGVGLSGSSSNPTTPEIRECLVRGNTANTRGGGIYFSYKQNALIERNRITGNTTLGTTGNLDGGAGIFAALDARCIIRNNLIHGNVSGSNGGGIKYFNLTGLVVVNNTIAGNQGGSLAGYANAGGFGVNVSALVENCILWGNGTSELAFTGLDKNSKAPFATITWSDVQGGATGTGNINLDPKLLNTASGNLRILPTSPCFNTGNAGAANIPKVDFEGKPRVLAVKVDMGAFECDPSRVFLWADRGTLPVSTGGKIQYTLAGGSGRAGHLYVLLPGFGGTDPGTPLGAIHLPLNLDRTTWILLNGFLATLTGNLDAGGGATPSIALPANLPREMVGLTLSTAALVIDSKTLGFNAASNDENVTFVP